MEKKNSISAYNDSDDDVQDDVLPSIDENVCPVTRQTTKKKRRY
jgi:hypothetical protein